MRSVLFRITFFLIITGFIFPVPYADAGKRVNLDITAASFRKLPVAVPYFEDKKQPGKTTVSGQKLADIASRALEFHGFIDIVPPENFSGRQDTNWSSVGADFTILANYTVNKKGVVLELRLNDVLEGRMLL